MGSRWQQTEILLAMFVFPALATGVTLLGVGLALRNRALSIAGKCILLLLVCFVIVGLLMHGLSMLILRIVFSGHWSPG